MAVCKAATCNKSSCEVPYVATDLGTGIPGRHPGGIAEDTQKGGAEWSDYPAGKSYDCKHPVKPIKSAIFGRYTVFSFTFKTLNKLISH